MMDVHRKVELENMAALSGLDGPIFDTSALCLTMGSESASLRPISSAKYFGQLNTAHPPDGKKKRRESQVRWQCIKGAARMMNVHRGVKFGNMSALSGFNDSIFDNSAAYGYTDPPQSPSVPVMESCDGLGAE